MDLTEPGDMRQATLCTGVASLTATAGRAPFNQHARQSPLGSGSAPKGREAVSDLRLAPRGRDQPRRRRRRSAAHRGTTSGALAHGRKDAR
ncbi:DUF6380 family protein [Streptomyces sp. NPDC002523]